MKRNREKSGPPMALPQAIEKDGMRILRAKGSITIKDPHGTEHTGPDAASLAEIEGQIKRGVRRIAPLVYVVW